MYARLTPLSGSALALALLLGLIGGCGGSSSSSGNGIASKSPTEIVAATRAAAEQASSVHLSGTIVSGGPPLTLDLDLLAGRGVPAPHVANGATPRLAQTGGVRRARHDAPH